MKITDEDRKRVQEQMDRYPGFSGEPPKVLPDSFLFETCIPPINVPEGKSGEFEVKHTIEKKGDTIDVVSMRNFIMTGYKQTRIELPYNRRIHQLIRHGQGLLMSDSPQEMFLQYDAYKAAKGRVLVGGLGLGMYACMIAKKKEVTEVVVIEIEEDVIKLTRPKNEKIKVIQGDFWDFIRTTDEKFDFIYCDIYYQTGATEYIKTVLPIRKILEERFPGVPNMFWAEKEMESQYTPEYHKLLEGGDDDE